MKASAKAIAAPDSDRSMRSFAIVAAALFFLLAQALFAAHASAPVEDLNGHSAADCAVCFAGGAADDPAKALPAIKEPSPRSEAVKTAIPAALLTLIAVRAASPRAPPHA
jgi:hypothetical protein